MNSHVALQLRESRRQKGTRSNHWHQLPLLLQRVSPGLKWRTKWSIASTCRDVEMEAMNSNELSEMEPFEDHDFAGQNKRIADLEQEIADLKSQLQNDQCQIRNLMEKQFTLENLKSKNNTIHFTLDLTAGMLLRQCIYLDPGERGKKYCLLTLCQC